MKFGKVAWSLASATPFSGWEILTWIKQGAPLSGRLAGTYEGTNMHFFAVNFRMFF